MKAPRAGIQHPFVRVQLDPLAYMCHVECGSLHDKLCILLRASRRCSRVFDPCTCRAPSPTCTRHSHWIRPAPLATRPARKLSACLRRSRCGGKDHGSAPSIPVRRHPRLLPISHQSQCRSLGIPARLRRLETPYYRAALPASSVIAPTCCISCTKHAFEVRLHIWLGLCRCPPVLPARCCNRRSGYPSPETDTTSHSRPAY